MFSSTYVFDKITSNSILSKDQFLTLYPKLKRSDFKDFCVSILCELQRSVLEDNFQKVDAMIKIMGYIYELESTDVLADCVKSERNPFRKSNLVIMACKHNKVNILKHINNFKILSDLQTSMGGKRMVFSDEDETCHNAFYYAIRSCNIELLEALISLWSGRDFNIDLEDLEDIISTSYRELKLRQVPVSMGMECYVIKKLLSLRFQCNSLEKHQMDDETIQSSVQNRIGRVIEQIKIVSEYKSHGKEIDDKFLYIAKIIALNIHALKRKLKFSYDTVPWEEIEFCLCVFISSYIKKSELNVFNLVLLTKDKIIFHLENVSKKLAERPVFLGMNVTKPYIMPKESRGVVVEKIIKCNPEFIPLYQDYSEIRDIYSLDKIHTYICFASSADPKEREGHITIIRAVQVIGEHLKNTLESPKLSESTSEFLLLSLPDPTRRIFIDLRNLLSHSASLSKRMEIEKNADASFFQRIQADLKHVGDVIYDIMFRKKVKIIRKILTDIVNSASMEDIGNALRVMDHVKFEQTFQMQRNKFETLIEQLDRVFSDKTKREQILLEKVRNLNASYGKNTDYNYIQAIGRLKSLQHRQKTFIADNNHVRGQKFIAKLILKSLTPEINEGTIPSLTEIFSCAERRVQTDELKKTILGLYNLAETEIDNLQWIEEFREILRKKGYFNSISQCKTSATSEGDSMKLLEIKFTELKFFLDKFKLSENYTNIISSYTENKSLQLVTEMLVLDILSILETPKSRNQRDMIFMDNNIPLVTGKQLRDHLAHCNNILDLLITDPVITVFVNALIISENINDKNILSSFQRCNSSRSKYVYHKDLSILLNQQNMLTSLKNGDLCSLRTSVVKGGDLHWRCLNSSTTLHLASKKPNLNLIKYLIENSNISVTTENIFRQLPLHMAAKYGMKEIVEFYINEKGVHIDAVDVLRKTPLFFAVINGHDETVSFLLKHKANITAKDLCFNTPLFYALRNRHLVIVKMLLEKNAHDGMERGPFPCLYIAAEGGCSNIVNYLLKNQHNVNTKTDRDCIPLHVASLNGHLDVVNILISKGAEINARCNTGCTPLHYAVENGHKQIVRVLLKHGAEANYYDKVYNNTPLHYAAGDGYIEIVDILLQNKANVNAKTVDGMTPLHFAAEAGHTDIVLLLIKHNTEVNSRNRINQTPLHLAAERGHDDIVDLLVKNNALIDKTDKNGFTPLHTAILNHHNNIVQLLLTNGAEISALGNYERTPLHVAAEVNNMNIIEDMILKKALVSARDSNGRTPLHEAAANGHTSAVDMLLKHKAEINSKDISGMTPLHLASTFGHKDVIDLFLENNVDLNGKSLCGNTPLLLSVMGDHERCVEILIRKGADMHLKNDDGVSPLTYAANSNNESILKILISKVLLNEDYYTALSIAICAGYKSIVQLLLKDRNIDNKVFSDADCSLLHLAAKKGNNSVLEVLLSNGADVNVVNARNVTPLYLAAEGGHEKTVEILLNYKVTLDIKTDEGCTPLNIAAAFGHLKVVELLINRGANINSKDLKNRTALELAVARGHIGVVKTLVENAGVDINNKGNNGLTVLHIAAQENNLELLKYLVSKGCNMHVRNDMGSKPIHIAARDGFIDAVQFFLDSGFDINELGVSDQTLLHYATLKGQLNTISFLLRKGADVNAKDKQGVTPLHLAARFSFKDVIELLIRSGAYYDVPDHHLRRKPSDLCNKDDVIKLFDSIQRLFKAAENNNPSEVEYCLKAGAIVNSKNSRNEAPLHLAARKGYIEIVNILLKSQCNLNIYDGRGFTPLHYACNFKVVEALLCHGAIYDITSENGEIPLNLSKDKNIIDLLTFVSEAFSMIQRNSPQIVTKLKRVKNVNIMKAVFNARNKENRTLVEIAFINNFPDIKQLENVLPNIKPFMVDKATTFAANGNYQNAITVLKREFELRKEFLGPDNPFTLEIQAKLAAFIYKQGRYQDALSLHEEIYQRQRKIFGDDNKSVIKTRGMLAVTMHRLGKNEQALSVCNEVFVKQKQILGCDHDDTLDTEICMALILDALEKYEEALSHNRNVYEKRQRENSAKAVFAQNNIAMVLLHQGKLNDAYEVYESVLRRKKKILGPEHPDTLRTFHNIANVLHLQGRESDALDNLNDLLNIQQKALGPIHPDTLNTQANIADIYFNQGKWLAAFTVLKENIDLRKTAFGPNDPIALKLSLRLEMVKLRFKYEDTAEPELLLCIQKDIIIACSNGDINTVKELLKNGSDINERDINGRIPLHFAVYNGDIGLVEFLLKNGANPTLATNKGNTPLHTAASRDNQSIVDILLLKEKANAFVNAVTFTGRNSALHVAAKNGCFPVVLALLKCGAVYNLTNQEKKMPVDLCTDEKTCKFLMLIEELFQGANSGNVETIEKLKTLEKEEIFAITNALNQEEYTLTQVLLMNKYRRTATQLLVFLKKLKH